MRSNIASLCLVILLDTATFMPQGCAPKKSINAEAIDVGMTGIIDRHQDYVRGDTTLDPADQATFLRTGDLMQGLLDEAMQRPATPAPAPIAGSHDLWNDLSPQSKRRILANRGELSYEQALYFDLYQQVNEPANVETPFSAPTQAPPE